MAFSGVCKESGLLLALQAGAEGAQAYRPADLYSPG